MSTFEIISTVATSLGVTAFAVIFTILYRSYTHASLKELKTGKRDIELMDAYIYEAQPSYKMRRKAWSIIKNVCFYGFLALLIPVFLFSIINKVQGNVSMMGNHSLMVVASGSMSQQNSANDYLKQNELNNQFDTYDMIVLERVDEGDELALYDVIAFVDDTGKNVIHRIVGVRSDGSFITRGDSNNKDDDFHPTADDVIGRYTDKRIPVVGALVMFFQSIGGIVTLIALVYCIFMLDRFNGMLHDEEAARLGQLRDAIELDLDPSAGALRAEFVETLYYKGFVYFFNDKGFVGKEEISDESYLEKSNSAAIRITNENGIRSEKEIFIETERGDEETP